MDTAILFTQQVVVGFPLIFEGKASVRDVVQVLEPLEVRDGYTTSVDVQVGDNEDVALNEDLVCSRRCRAVGSFGDDLHQTQRSLLITNSDRPIIFPFSTFA